MANNDKYAQLLKDKEFVKWFWFGNNGNTLIKHLNSDKSRDEIVRREKYSPYAYGIVLNVNLFGDKFKENLKTLNLLKLVSPNKTQAVVVRTG